MRTIHRIPQRSPSLLDVTTTGTLVSLQKATTTKPKHPRPPLHHQSRPHHPALLSTPTTSHRTSPFPPSLASTGPMYQDATTVVLGTSIVSVISGFMLGVYSIRGYLLISPALADERRHNTLDPVESDESDVDEDDTILDHAPNWANGEEADARDGLRVDRQQEEEGRKKKEAADKTRQAARKVSVGAVDNGEECKLVLVVRTDLGMTKGKIAAQCSHATLACYKKLSAKSITNPTSHEAALLRRWERHGQAKIAVQVKSQDEIMEIMGKAKSLGITAEAIHDAGRTQIEAGSLTVVGVGPAPKSMVDQVTGGLKLL